MGAADKAAVELAGQLRVQTADLPPGERFPSAVEISITTKATEGTIRRARGILVTDGVIVPYPTLHDVYLIAGPDDPAPAPTVTQRYLPDPQRRRDPLHTRPTGLELGGARSAQHTLRALLADHHDGMDAEVRAGIQSALSDLSRTVPR
jgi:hypothetical protein